MRIFHHFTTLITPHFTQNFNSSMFSVKASSSSFTHIKRMFFFLPKSCQKHPHNWLINYKTSLKSTTFSFIFSHYTFSRAFLFFHFRDYFSGSNRFHMCRHNPLKCFRCFLLQKLLKRFSFFFFVFISKKVHNKILFPST